MTIRQMLQMSSEASMVQLSLQQNGSITIRGRLPTVAETAGVITPLTPPREWKEIEATVRDEVAERYRDSEQS